jgi:hypothetical protein
LLVPKRRNDYQWNGLIPLPHISLPIVRFFVLSAFFAVTVQWLKNFTRKNP